MFNRIIFVIMIFVVTACTPALVEAPASPQVIPERPTKDSSTITATPSPIVDEGLQKKFIQIVSNDLATRLSLDVQSISVVSAEAITWPNAALGCPLSGKVYAQGTVPGFRIRLKAEDKEYSYHTDQTGQFVLCTTMDPDLEGFPELPAPTGEIDDGQPWLPVD
jgi:hypothetical protein